MAGLWWVVVGLVVAELEREVGGAVVSTEVWRDADGDGQGDPGKVRRGPPGGGWVGNDLDCDDADARVRAFAEDTVGDGLDADCDGCDGTCPD